MLGTVDSFGLVQQPGKRRVEDRKRGAPSEEESEKRERRHRCM